MKKEKCTDEGSKGGGSRAEGVAANGKALTIEVGTWSSQTDLEVAEAKAGVAEAPIQTEAGIEELERKVEKKRASLSQDVVMRDS